MACFGARAPAPQSTIAQSKPRECKVPTIPRFGEADLSNCDRELIQHPGSIQPHGAMLVLDAASPVVLQASANTREMLGIDVGRALGKSIEVLGGDLAAQVWTRVLAGVRATPRPFRGYIERDGVRRGFEALIHRNEADAVILELEPVDLDEAAALARDLPHRLPVQWRACDGAVARRARQ